MKGMIIFMAEYSFPTVQTIETGNNVLFTNGYRCCKKGYVQHRDSSGIFTLKGAGCKALYRVQFNANIAIAEGGTVEPISVAISLDGETLNNAEAIVTPTVAEAFFNVSIATYIEVPCGCCVTISVKNTSDTTDVDVVNANLIIDRVA
jgi:hypothetical protein